jgi:hypothetical protein
MAHGTFTPVGQSTYAHDQGRAEFYRRQEQQRRAHELAERAARWLAGRLAGLEFTHLSGLTTVALECAEHWHGGLTAEQTTAIRQGCVLLWLGEATRDDQYRRVVERSEAGVRFTEAA